MIRAAAPARPALTAVKRGICLVPLVVLAAGCGGEAPPAEVPTPAVTSSSSAAPTAADGSDYAACADGTCEVRVRGPVDIPLTGQGGLHRISVDAVTADGLGFATDSGATGTLTPGCVLTLYENGSGSSCSSGAPQKPRPVDGVLALQIADLRDGTAILRLVSGKVGPPPASLRPPLPPPPWTR